MNQSKAEEMNSERELLYKVLFDMRSDINDLKRMVSDMHGEFTRHMVSTERKDIAGLLPSKATAQEPEIYAESEEVVDEPAHEMSKADMQRELIVRALRKHGGSRRAAAAELFMSERTLYRKIKELGIKD